MGSLKGLGTSAGIASGKVRLNLTAPRSPLGFALQHFFSTAEQNKFKIPAEIVRGEAVAAIVYSDGSVHAKHLKPN